MRIVFGDTDGDAECNALRNCEGYIVNLRIPGEEESYDCQIREVTNRGVQFDRLEKSWAYDAGIKPLWFDTVFVTWEHIDRVFIY